MAIKRGKPGKAHPEKSRSSGFTGAKRKIARYGGKPDLPDQRNYSYAVPSDLVKDLS